MAEGENDTYIQHRKVWSFGAEPGETEPCMTMDYSQDPEQMVVQDCDLQAGVMCYKPGISLKNTIPQNEGVIVCT